jgi:glycosyltransferase involved in cell wall biosynthesis
MKNAVIIYHRYLDAHGGAPLIGGVQTYLRELSLLLNERGFSVRIVQAADSDFEVSEGVCTVYGVRIGKFASRFLFFVRRAMARKARALLRADDDVVIYGSDHFVVPIGSNKTIAIQHGIDWDLPSAYMGRTSSRSKLYAALQKCLKARSAVRSLDKATWRVCVDYNFLNWLRTISLSPLERYRVIPNFVDLRGHEEVNGPGSGTATVKVLFARRFYEYRGTRLIAGVFQRLMDAGIQAEFTFAGNGPDEALLKEMFVGRDNVRFLTYRPEESLALHAGHDIAIVPSLGCEGTSLSIAEASAAGCAVVASNVGGIPNMMIHGWNGLMVQPTSDEFYAAVHRLIVDEEERARLANNALAIARHSFSVERWRGDWSTLLNEVVAG